MLTGKIYHPEGKHPPEYQHDLNPAANAGVNRGELAGHPENAWPTAYDEKDAHRLLRDTFDDDELRQIPVLPAGTRLKQDAVYVDLRDPSREEVHARGDMSAGEGQMLVPKAEVGYELYNRLRTNVTPGQTGG